jgi:CSLREA domain-containing protein
MSRSLIALSIGVLVAAFLALPSPRAQAANYFVTSNADVGDGVCDATCTLRDAILTANGTGVGDTITFDNSVFQSGSPATITLASGLPALSGGGDTIDGTGAGVIVDGAGEPSAFSCLTITSLGNTVKGLQVTDCTNGVLLNNANSRNNVVGPNNVLFDNTNGISISNVGATGNQIVGNKIGTSADGTVAHPNGGNSTGISISAAPQLSAARWGPTGISSRAIPPA